MDIILIDDEPLALNYLERILKKYYNLLVVKKFTHLDVNQECELISRIDVVFLDIEMPEKNGLILAREILQINPNVYIIFVTGHSNYAINAFDIDAFDFILKPIQLDRLQLTLERIYRNLNEKNTKSLLSNDLLKINLFGNLTFELNGKIEIFQWRTAKVKELFIYLLQNDKKIIHKAKLIELLWPELDHAKAYSRLYNTVYQLRNNLYLFNKYFSLRNIGHGYMLETNNVWIDIIEWKNKITSVSSVTVKSVTHVENLMSLYTESYLVELDYLWLIPDRRHLEQLWLKVAYELIHFYSGVEDFEKVELWYSKICSFFPEDEGAHFELMKIYAHSKQGILVDYLYKKLKNTFTEINAEVSSDIQNWYKQWKKTKKLIFE